MAVILIVDDDVLVSETIGMHLRSADHEAIFAAHGGEALETLRCRAVDVVVTDIVMPEVEGIGFILSARREGYTVPILAMSGGRIVQVSDGNELDYLKVAKDLGANRILRKPFTRRQFLDQIEACLNQARDDAGGGV